MTRGMAVLIVGWLALLLGCSGAPASFWRSTSADVRRGVVAVPEPELPPKDPFAPPVPTDALRGDPLAPDGARRAPAGPTLLQRAATRVRNAFVLKLSPRAATGSRARWARMVDRIGELGTAIPFRPLDTQTAERLDLGRWRTFRSHRPYEDVVSRLEQNSDIAWVEAVVRLAGTREAAELDLEGVTTIRALASPDDPTERTITSLVLAERLVAAVDAGATTVWVPWVGLEHTEVVAEACAYARERGVTVIAPVGDQGYVDFVAHPAALDTTIAVGAEPPGSRVESVEARFLGNRGAGLDLVAPGADSLAASAEVAAFVARLPWLEADRVGPPDLLAHPRRVWQRLTSSAFDLGPIGWDPATGHGRLDPEAAEAWSSPAGEAPLIVAHRVERRSGHRAVLSWVTIHPATTEVKWPGGSAKRDSASRTHRVVVRGKPGEVRRYAIVSESGPHRDRRRVSVQF